MTGRLKTFISAFLLSMPFWWGTNVLEKNLSDFLFWRNISQNPQILLAQAALEEKARNVKPVLRQGAQSPEIDAAAAVSLYLGGDGEEKILFEKEAGKKLPVASLTKLMTAYAVLKNYDLSKEIKNRKGDEIFPTEYFLYPLLIESDNDAAFALANHYDGMDERKFVDLMNEEAKKLNLNDTFFFNPSGLDPDDLKRPDKEINYSTASDLAKLSKELLNYPLIWKILAIPEFDLFGPELKNTNELLSEIPSVVGGKTGYTEKAGGCIILALKAPKSKGYIINVILGADGAEARFEEMKKLTDWLNESYKW